MKAAHRLSSAKDLSVKSGEMLLRTRSRRAIFPATGSLVHVSVSTFAEMGRGRRDPDALYLNWIAALDQNTDPRIMVNGFMNSLEYRQRFGPRAVTTPARCRRVMPSQRLESVRRVQIFCDFCLSSVTNLSVSPAFSRQPDSV